jgi:Spy/CpxP family protein refolding chaperone
MRKVLLTILSMIFVISIAGMAMAQVQGQNQGSQSSQGAQGQDQGSQSSPSSQNAQGQNQDQGMSNMDQGDQGSQAANQDQYRSHHMMPRWWERPKIIEQLKLTDEQRNRIKAIYDKNSQDLDKMRTDLRAQGKQLRDMLTQDKLDENAISKQIDTLTDTLSKLVKAELQMNVAMMNELTVDQRKQLVQMHEQWMQKMKQRRGQRGMQTK